MDSDSVVQKKHPAAVVLERDIEILNKKAADYSPGDDPYENFRSSADFVRDVTGYDDVNKMDTCLVLIGTKISRLRTLGMKRKASNENLIDTISDLRVYLAIWQSMLETEDGV